MDEDEEADAENMNTFGVESLSEEKRSNDDGLNSSFLTGFVDDILSDNNTSQIKSSQDASSGRLSVFSNLRSNSLTSSTSPTTVQPPIGFEPRQSQSSSSNTTTTIPIGFSSTSPPASRGGGGGGESMQSRNLFSGFRSFTQEAPAPPQREFRVDTART